MKTVKLGSQGLEVSELGYGCMGLTTAYGPKKSDDEIVKLLKKVYECGVNFWDTANLYVYPDFWRLLSFRSPLVCQEEIIARAIKEVGRENIVIATKTGIELHFFPKFSVRGNGSPAFIRKECEDSLRRLEVDQLDLFYLHRIDSKIPIEVTMATMRALVNEGKVKYVGLSECSANTLRRAHKVHPISCVQIEWSLWSRDVEEDLIPTCAELGIGVVAYSPLGRGFFSSESFEKEYSRGDYRAGNPRFAKDALKSNLELLKKVEEIAQKKDCSTAQLALAWVAHKSPLLKGAGVVAIPGTTKESHLLSNVESVNITLSDEEVAQLEAAVPASKILGGRYDASDPTYKTDNNPELTDDDKRKYNL